jgi:tocopherol cyclase
MKTALPIFLIMLLLVAAGCTSDYEDPYASKASPELEWPTLDPNRYHWDGFSNPYYENWHYKVTDSATGRSFAINYGVQNPGFEPGNVNGAFLYLQRDDGERILAEIPLSEFTASVARCDVHIAGAHATETHITGGITTENGDVSWDLHFEILAEWSRTMGVLTNIPLLSANWYVNALNARVSGSIEWLGETTEFADAPAFNDHTWGTIFPDTWLRIHAEDFQEPDRALALAGGPFSLSYIKIPAYMLVFDSRGKRHEYRSQDINVAFTEKIDLEAGSVILTATRGSDRIRVTVWTNPDSLVPFLAPTYTGLDFGGLETFSGAYIVELMEKIEGEWEVMERATTNTGVLQVGNGFINQE